jgi:hypothetical protein
VIILPVSDVDRALAFSTQQTGFRLDIAYQPSDDFRSSMTPSGASS